MTIRAEKIYSCILAFFVVVKMLRAFSGSAEVGGVWNLIQVFYVVFGTFAFMKYLPTVSRQKSVLFLATYSIWALMVSLVTFTDASLPSLFRLLKTMVPGMGLVFFYIFGLKYNNFAEYENIIKVAFYISAGILAVSLARHMLFGGYRSSEVGSVADVYYLLSLLPFILCVTQKKKWLIPMGVTAVCILLSQKRLGQIAFVGTLLVIYLTSALYRNDVKSVVKNAIIVVIMAVLGFFLFKYMDQTFNLRVVDRILQLETDGGSNRDEIWSAVWDSLNRSSVIQLLFGHGHRSISTVASEGAHNDFLQITYEFGITSLFLYISFFISSLFVGIRMIKEQYAFSPCYLASIWITLCIAMFSVYIVEATYSICGAFAQGVILAHWLRWRNVRYLDSGGTLM